MTARTLCVFARACNCGDKGGGVSGGRKIDSMPASFAFLGEAIASISSAALLNGERRAEAVLFLKNSPACLGLEKYEAVIQSVTIRLIVAMTVEERSILFIRVLNSIFLAGEEIG